MERIRVDTDELKAKAKVFESSANVYSKAGDEILNFVAGLPSYDGQLSGPARATALEINRQCKDISDCYSTDAQRLASTAKAFEEVDNQAVDAFNDNQATLPNDVPDYMASSAPIRQAGNHDLGYEDYGDYIIVWRNGESQKKIITNENRSLVEKYEKDVDDYCKYLSDALAALRDLMIQGMGLGQIALLIGILAVLGFISTEIVGFLLLSLGVSAELLGSAMDNAKELAAHYLGEYGDDLAEKLGSLLNPADPLKYLNDINKLIQYCPAAALAYGDVISDWSALIPPQTPSGPTAVPAPTAPAPTQTPTPPAP